MIRLPFHVPYHHLPTLDDDVFSFGHWNLIPLGHENLRVGSIDCPVSRFALYMRFPTTSYLGRTVSWACLSSPPPYMFLYYKPRTKFSSRRRMNKCRETMMNGWRPSFATTAVLLLIIKLHFETAGSSNSGVGCLNFSTHHSTETFHFTCPSIWEGIVL